MDGAFLGASLGILLSQALVIQASSIHAVKNTINTTERVAGTSHKTHDVDALNMTFVSVGDLDPGGDRGQVQAQHFNVVETVVWLSECQSNSSPRWLLTTPVCTTKFTSFLLFVAVTLVLGVITLWTILGNILVLWALYRYRYLRTMSNCLIGNLAVSDLLLAITVLPISTANDLLGYWVFGRTMCTVWLSIDVLYCTASIWGLCTIAFDRYTATVYPMWYHDKRSTKKALAYMLFVWVFSIVISLAPFIGWQDMISGFYIYEASINRHQCILFSSQSYVVYSAMGSFILPSCFMTFLYVQIFVVLHRQADSLKKKSSVTSQSPTGLANGCPTIAISPTQDVSCVVTRDFTASTFMAEETFVDRDDDEEEKEEDDEEEEEEEEDEEGYREEKVSFITTEFDDEASPTESDVVHIVPPPGLLPVNEKESPTVTDVYTVSPTERAELRLPGSRLDDPIRSPLARIEFDLDDSGVDGNSNSDASANNKHDDVNTLLLRDHRSNSLNVEVETSFRRNRSMLPQPKQDYLTVSTCDIPLQLKLKKSRSAAFNLQENASEDAGFNSGGGGGGVGGGGDSYSRVSPGVQRSKSASTLYSRTPDRKSVSEGGRELENGQTGASSLSLHRFSIPWHGKRSNHMTTSMRRRFQLREQRATKRMLLIMACFFVCWVPFTLMYMLRSLCEHCQHLNEHLAAFIIWLGYANSSLNPLLYTLFNDDFRKAFKKLLRIHRPRRRTRVG
ncbi:octopamine receptor 2-like [Littorina saxatilis]|uniref:octopamine receptor 2-like n=1 Tax=Littorina saxatilis TaxID=31220 RepID=UPI0038B59F24